MCNYFYWSPGRINKYTVFLYIFNTQKNQYVCGESAMRVKMMIEIKTVKIVP